MATIVHRTMFALDEATSIRLKRLAAHWHISQAEVVRRSLVEAEKRAETQQPAPAAMLRELFASGRGLDSEKAKAYTAEVYKDRKHWRGE